LTIDFGELGIKKSSAGITNYGKEELVGRQVIAIVNFPPRQIATFLSEVLVLGALTDEGVILLQPERVAPLGAVIA
jgi:tRNA-binding protein